MTGPEKRCDPMKLQVPFVQLPVTFDAAAHAGCFSMALGFKLQTAGHTATRIDTRAEVAMETSPGPTATGVHLSVEASVPGLSAEEFAAIAEDAKANCVISRVLSIPVTLDARLL